MKPRYRRMLEGMRTADAPAGKPEWNVYIVRCADDTLYTGVAKCVEDRLEKHNAGRGAAYTRTRRPVTLIYSQSRMTRSQALIREAQIKRLPRPQKEKLSLGERGS